MLTLVSFIVSLKLVKYFLVYKFYIEFIVIQMLNIICSRQWFSHRSEERRVGKECRP